MTERIEPETIKVFRGQKLGWVDVTYDQLEVESRQRRDYFMRTGNHPGRHAADYLDRFRGSRARNALGALGLWALFEGEKPV